MSDRPSRALAMLQRVRRGPQSAVGQRVLLAVAGVAFLGLTVLGYRALPPDREPFDPLLLTLLIVVGGPAMLAVTANEYRELGRLCGVSVAPVEAARVTVVGAIANLLPIPGAVLVRTGDLLGRDARTRNVAAGITLFGMVFVGVAAATVAAAFVVAGRPAPAAVAMVAATGLITVAGLLGRRAGVIPSLPALGRVVAVETSVMVVVVLRLAVVLAAIGVDTGFIEAATLGTASVLSTAIAIFPGGLGLREALSGVLGSIVGVEVATGIVASSVDRLTYLASLGVISLLAMVRLRRQPRPEPASEGSRCSPGSPSRPTSPADFRSEP